MYTYITVANSNLLYLIYLLSCDSIDHSIIQYKTKNIMLPEALEEISALQAIYDDLEVNSTSNNDGNMHINCSIVTSSGQTAILHILVSSTYPFSSKNNNISTQPLSLPANNTNSASTSSFRLRIDISGLPRGTITQQAEEHIHNLIEQVPDGEAICLFPIIAYFREEFALNPLLNEPSESTTSVSNKSFTKDHDESLTIDNNNNEDNDNHQFSFTNEELQNIIIRDGELSFIPRRKPSLTSSSSSSVHPSSTSALDIIPIIHGKPHVEKKSTFQCHLARVQSKEEISDILVALKSVPKIARATHNMYAYRFIDPDNQSLVADNDDDGEDAAGGKLAELLYNMQVYNILIIVSRWYGGVLMGPSRFKTINNVARELIEQQEWYQQEHTINTKDKDKSNKKNK